MESSPPPSPFSALLARKCSYSFRDISTSLNKGRSCRRVSSLNNLSNLELDPSDWVQVEGDRLELCTQKFKQHKAESPSPKTGAQDLAAEVHELEELLGVAATMGTRLSEELELTQKSNAELTQHLALLQDENSGLCSKLRDLELQFKVLKSSSETKDATISQQSDELDELREKLLSTAVPTHNRSPEANDSAENEAEIERLTAELVSAQRDLRARTDSLTSLSKALKTEREAALAWENQVVELRQQLDKQQSEAQHMQHRERSRSRAADDNLSVVLAEAASLKVANASVHALNTSLTEQLQEKNAQLVDLSKSLEDAKTAITEREITIENLHKQLNNQHDNSLENIPQFNDYDDQETTSNSNNPTSDQSAKIEDQSQLQLTQHQLVEANERISQLQAALHQCHLLQQAQAQAQTQPTQASTKCFDAPQPPQQLMVPAWVAAVAAFVVWLAMFFGQL